MAAELAPRGIAVIVISPGWVQTDMGGSGAPLAPAKSAAGIVKVIDALTLSGTGTYMNYDGRAIAW
jgi:NAD(P)-dependent dehydrogenase (short-subunit alcohol dehydrogenase family)